MVVPVADVASYLDANHYLGAARRGFAWRDRFGVLVLSNPSSRHLPPDWLELTRWCLKGESNAGSQQWAAVVAHLVAHHQATTVVSYSDPSVGHTGALYRACNWGWAPTWQRLRPPPSGNGDWGTGAQSVKDRWVFSLRVDERRAKVLAIKDAAVERRFPTAGWREPRLRRGRPITGTGGGAYIALDSPRQAA